VASSRPRYTVNLEEVAPVEPPTLKPGERTIFARWDAAHRYWLVKVPSSGWTRLQGVWAERETEAALMTALRLTHGAQALRGLRVVKVVGP